MKKMTRTHQDFHIRFDYSANPGDPVIKIIDHPNAVTMRSKNRRLVILLQEVSKPGGGTQEIVELFWKRLVKPEDRERFVGLPLRLLNKSVGCTMTRLDEEGYQLLFLGILHFNQRRHEKTIQAAAAETQEVLAGIESQEQTLEAVHGADQKENGPKESQPKAG